MNNNNNNDKKLGRTMTLDDFTPRKHSKSINDAFERLKIRR